MTPDPRGNESDIGSDDAGGPLGRGPTRRQALALAGGTAAVLGAAVGPFSHLFVAGAADGDGPPEIVLASWLIGLELAAVELYESVRTSPDFDDSTQKLATTCSGHHDAQSSALAGMVSATGAEVPSEANALFLAQFKPQVTAAGDGAAKAGVFAQMEDGFAATYYESFTTVTSTSLASIVAQILATDAAQAVAWSAAANGQGSDHPLPPPAAIPVAQSAAGAFDRAGLTPAPATSAAAAETTTGDAS